MKRTGWLLGLVCVMACGSDTTSAGDSACAATQLADGSVEIRCGDDPPVILQAPSGMTGAEGPKGEPGTRGAMGDPGPRGETGIPGPAGEDGSSIAVRTQEATPAQCAFGGEVVYTGRDLDGNGMLDIGEEAQSFVVCQGAPGDGKAARASVTDASVAECAAGGKVLEVGLDLDQSGALEPAEVDERFVLCNGVDGTDGQDGTNGQDGAAGAQGAPGQNAWIEVSLGSAQSCASGSGDIVRVGVDQNANGMLEPAEISATFEVCDGQDGQDGAAGMNGQDGMDGAPGMNGQDGMDGAPGMNGQDGMDGADGRDGRDGRDGSGQPGLNSLLRVTPEPAGANCASGGTKIEAGLDANNNGVLDNDEVSAANTSYLCSDGSSIIPTPGSAIADKIAVGGTGLTTDATSFFGSNGFGCALTNTGGVRCWGRNLSGQLGDGTIDSRTTAAEVQGLPGTMIDVESGWRHTCAIRDNGEVWCWGDNDYAQLGNDSNTDSIFPVQVQGLTAPATALATGAYHTCAILQGGSAACWGRNSVGQLGDGSTTLSRTAVAVTGLTASVEEIDAGEEHTCARLNTGAVFCWGSNAFDQLGRDTSGGGRETPAAVQGLTSGVRRISTGSQFSCAALEAGGAKCWGAGRLRQLGNAAQGSVRSQVPVDVDGFTQRADKIVSGAAFSCALLPGGRVQCWGNNRYGALGNNSTASSYSPVDVSGLTSGATDIDIGSSTACAVVTDGSVRCWGYFYLGDGTTDTSGVPVRTLGFGP